MKNVTNEQITELLEKVRTLKEKSDSDPDVISVNGNIILVTYVINREYLGQHTRRTDQYELS